MEKRENMVDKAYQIISDKILRFELPPGQIVSDHLLCQDLEMSRTPVREALVRLEQDGLVASCEDRKTMVSQAGLLDIVEIYQARMAIETKAAELILDKDGVTPEFIEALEQSQEQMRLQLEARDLRGNFSADDAFHLALMEFAGNSRMTEFFKRLRMQVMRARYLSVTMPNRTQMTLGEHGRILQAFKQREKDVILNAINNHLESAILNYRNILGHAPQNAGLANAHLVFSAQQDARQRGD